MATVSSGQLVWSKGRQSSGARAALTKWTGWTFTVAVHCYDDSTINIVAAITIIITIIIIINLLLSLPYVQLIYFYNYSSIGRVHKVLFCKL